jgi:hypothetical protein
LIITIIAIGVLFIGNYKYREIKTLLIATIRIMQRLIRARVRICALALIAMVKPLRKDWKNLFVA